MALNVEKQLQSIKNGSFKGGNFRMSADTDSMGYVSETGRQQLSADTLSKLDEAYAQVRDGNVVPASGDNRMTPKTFKGL
jgi:basic membrane protein A